MKVELSELQIKNTLYFLGDVELRGKATAVIAEMVSLRLAYERMLGKPDAPTAATPALVDADVPKPPNRAQRRRKNK